MSPPGYSRRKSKGLFLDLIDGLTSYGLQIGGVVFGLTSVYLLWGMLAGPLANIGRLPTQEHIRIWQNVQYAAMALTISGCVLMASAAIRFYDEETLGFLFLLFGAAFYWGTPIALSAALRVYSLGAGSPIGYVLGVFRFVGMVALGLAVPFIALDFWHKLTGSCRTPKRGAVNVKKEEKPSQSVLYFYCWQMPYCRDYLRQFCKAYDKRKSCWRLKCGCYCDEDMILRVMKRSKTSKIEGFDQRYTQVAGKSARLSAAQKRERCRQCFIYAEHQKQKYRILSPLAFPVALFLMWMYLTPAKAFLTRGLEVADWLAGQFSFAHAADKGMSSQWANSPAVSETVIWVFLVCICFIVATFVLRGMEYCIFGRQY